MNRLGGFCTDSKTIYHALRLSVLWGGMVHGSRQEDQEIPCRRRYRFTVRLRRSPRFFRAVDTRRRARCRFRERTKPSSFETRLHFHATDLLRRDCTTMAKRDRRGWSRAKNRSGNCCYGRATESFSAARRIKRERGEGER